MTQDLRFRVNFQPIQGYSERRRLTLKVQDGTGYSRPYIKFEWCLNTEDPASRGWYGCDLTITASSKNCLDTLVKMARRVIGRPEYDYDAFNPHDIVARLRRIKATEEAYDTREGEFIPLAEMKGPEYERWSDDHKAVGEEYLCVAVLACSEYDARELIAEKFNAIHRSDRSEARFAAWILAGRPVKQKDRSAFWSDGEIDTRTVEEKIADAEAECVPEPEPEVVSDEQV